MKKKKEQEREREKSSGDNKSTLQISLPFPANDFPFPANDCYFISLFLYNSITVRCLPRERDSIRGGGFRVIQTFINRNINKKK